jgi:hypothetical protein
MSIHRFKRRGPNATDLNQYVVNGATVSAFGPEWEDISLANDADLDDLKTIMDARGLAFVSTTPATEGTGIDAPFVTKTTVPGAYPYTILPTDMFLQIDASAARTINLPNPAGRGRFCLQVVAGDSGTNAITLARFGGENIQGVAANMVVYANQLHLWIYSDGTDWWVWWVSSGTGNGTPLATGAQRTDANATVTVAQRYVLPAGTLTVDRTLTITPPAQSGAGFLIEVGTQGAGLDYAIANGGPSAGTLYTVLGGTRFAVWAVSDGTNMNLSAFMPLGEEPT